jgi:hypothetical protein
MSRGVSGCREVAYAESEPGARWGISPDCRIGSARRMGRESSDRSRVCSGDPWAIASESRFCGVRDREDDVSETTGVVEPEAWGSDSVVWAGDVDWREAGRLGATVWELSAETKLPESDAIDEDVNRSDKLGIGRGIEGETLAFLGTLVFCRER